MVTGGQPDNFRPLIKNPTGDLWLSHLHWVFLPRAWYEPQAILQACEWGAGLTHKGVRNQTNFLPKANPSQWSTGKASLNKRALSVWCQLSIWWPMVIKYHGPGFCAKFCWQNRYHWFVSAKAGAEAILVCFLSQLGRHLEARKLKSPSLSHFREMSEPGDLLSFLALRCRSSWAQGTAKVGAEMFFLCPYTGRDTLLFDFLKKHWNCFATKNPVPFDSTHASYIFKP